jgi:PAS domain S-box-containing protein
VGQRKIVIAMMIDLYLGLLVGGASYSKMISEKKNDLNLRVDLLNDAPMGIFIAHGRDLAIEYVNKCATALVESKAQQPFGMPMRDLLPEVLSQAVLDDIHTKCLADGKSVSIREQQIVLFVDGKIRLGWYDITVTPIPNDSRSVESVIFYFADVTANVQSKRSIALNEDYFTNFFRQAPVALVLYRGEDFIVDLANDKALEIWGKSIEEIKGKPIIEIFPEVESDSIIRARHAESLVKLKRGETHVVNEVQLTFLRNGLPQTGWYNYIHEPYKDINGNVIGMMAIAIDITQQVVARKQLELITDAIPSLVSYVNNREQYEFVNTAYEKWFAKSKDDVVGKSLAEVLGDTAYAKIKGHLDKALSGNLVSFDSWLDYKDGGKRFISATYVPHFDESKRVLGYFGLVNDLTERKRYEQTIEENEQRMRLLLEGIGAGAFDYDLLTGAIHWSNDLKELLGLSPDQIVDADIAHAVVHPDDANFVLDQTSGLRNGLKEQVALDYRIVRRDNGTVRWMHSRYKVLFSDKKQPVRITGFTIDVTDRKLNEEKLNKFNHQLENDVKERTSELIKANQLLVDKNNELRNAQSVLQQLIDSSIELIAVVDRDLNFLAVNTAFEKFVHKSSAELIGKHIFEVYRGAKGSKQVELLQKALAGERLHLKANPSISRPNDVWFDTHIVPLEIDGKVEGVIVLSRNISDIVKSELALAKVNKQLEEAQRLSKLGSWEWDVNAGNVTWSDEMYRIYGYENKFPVDFVKATERMSPEHAERSSRRTQQHIQTAIDNFNRTGELIYEISSLEFPIKLPDGREKILRSSGKLELDPTGKLHRIVGVIQDVTEIRSAEERLRQLVSELEMKNKDLESFNFVASHDLQEPLRKIQTFIDRIKSGGTTEDVKAEYLNRIDNAAKRMGDLIQSMLTLGRLSKHEDHFTEVDLNSIVDYCKSEFELVIREKGAIIQSEDLPVIRASDFQMRQLFINLISNSFKFSNEKPFIKIDCEKVKRDNTEHWRLTFTDNGIGFDPKYKEQIFELFQRLHSKSEFSGTGIGLNIVKRIVERHNGFIEATSAPGKGASFTIYLPSN